MPICSDRVCKTFTELGFVMVRLLKTAFSTILLSETTDSHKVTTTKSKRKSRNTQTKSSPMKEFFWQSSKHFSFLLTIHSKWLWSRTKYPKTDLRQPIDAATWLIYVLVHTCRRPTESKDSKLLKTQLPIGWETSRTMTFKESMRFRSLSRINSTSISSSRKSSRREITET